MRAIFPFSCTRKSQSRKTLFPQRLGILSIYTGKLRLENQIDRAIPFWNLTEIEISFVAMHLLATPL